jgi:hypothetical protein
MAFTRGVRAIFVDTEHEIPNEDGDPRGPLVSQCTGCGEPEFQTVSLEGVLEAIDRYEDAQKAAATAVEPPPPPPPAPPPPEPKRPPLGPLGGAGLTALSLGGAAAIAGVVLVALPARSSTTAEDGNEMYLELRSTSDFRTPGFVTLGSGVAVATIGAVLFALDRKRARHRDTLAVVPTAGSEVGYGVGVRGRF